MVFFLNFNGMNRTTYCGEYMLNKSFFKLKVVVLLKKIYFKINIRCMSHGIGDVLIYDAQINNDISCIKC